MAPAANSSSNAQTIADAPQVPTVFESIGHVALGRSLAWSDGLRLHLSLAGRFALAHTSISTSNGHGHGHSHGNGHAVPATVTAAIANGSGNSNNSDNNNNNNNNDDIDDNGAVGPLSIPPLADYAALPGFINAAVHVAAPASLPLSHPHLAELLDVAAIDSIAVLESVARQLLRSGFTSIVVLLDHSLVAQFKAAIAGPTAASTAQNASRYNFAELADVLIVLTNSAGDQSTFRSLDAATGIVAVVDGINSYRIVNGAVSSTVAVAPNTPIQPDTLVGSGNILISTSNILALLANQIQQSAAGNQPDAASLLRNITTDAAARLGLTHRGVIEDGSFADLILVKVPSHINQNSILTSFLLAPSAVAPTIKAVVKNGRFVYVDDEFAEILKVARLSHYYRYGSTYSLAAGFDGVGHVNSDCVFDTVESAIEAFKNGEYLVVLDSEDRENEGDLIIAAEDFTPEKAAFMIRYTSGLICAPATGDILDRLELPLMVKNNTESLKTAYTISLDKKQGTTTGISASDRSATVMHMANPTSTAAEFSRPGHIFPLRSVPGGVLQRVGHTEAATDLCILSGKKPVAAICEIVLDNGKMARRDDLRAFSDRFGFKMITIDDLVKYRRQHGI